jgi:carbon monoxide dehydrogenase subunit G
MEFDNTLEVPLPPAETWNVLLDIKRIAGCIPGAELTEVVDENTYKGKVAVRLGPVALSLAGHAMFEQIDASNHYARVKAHGTDPKGRGSADSIIEFRLEPAGAGTRVLIHSDVKLAGAIAQYGRAQNDSELASQFGQFGTALKTELAISQPPWRHAETPVARPSPSKLISGFSDRQALWTGCGGSKGGHPSEPRAAARESMGVSIMGSLNYRFAPFFIRLPETAHAAAIWAPSTAASLLMRVRTIRSLPLACGTRVQQSDRSCGGFRQGCRSHRWMLRGWFCRRGDGDSPRSRAIRSPAYSGSKKTKADNRLGFNSKGLAAFQEQLNRGSADRARASSALMLKNRDATDAAGDYATGIAAVCGFADYGLQYIVAQHAGSAVSRRALIEALARVLEARPQRRIRGSCRRCSLRSA